MRATLFSNNYSAEALDAFEALGAFFRGIKTGRAERQENNGLREDFEKAVEKAREQNPWFTEENILLAVSGWGRLLEKEKLSRLAAGYPAAKREMTIVIIMAGNIPLVGFHDLLCVLLSGHRAAVKPSSEDSALMGFVCRALTRLAPGLAQRIEVISRLDDAPFDAAIATGSDASAREFERLFSGKKRIIRSNRNSVALLTGEESGEELEKLSDDILLYYGKGCRSVSKIFLPKEYDLKPLLRALEKHRRVIENPKYGNNYRYRKAMHLIQSHPAEFDTGFLIAEQTPLYSTGIGSLGLEYYNDRQDVFQKLENDRDKIQCIVCREGLLPGTVRFGQAQFPDLDDWADGVDTLGFLTFSDQ